MKQPVHVTDAHGVDTVKFIAFWKMRKAMGAKDIRQCFHTWYGTMRIFAKRED